MTPFRAPEAAQSLRDDAVHRLTVGLDQKQRAEATAVIDDLRRMHGPFVESYPIWHPLLTWAHHEATSLQEAVTFNLHTLFPGIDHVYEMRNAILTCPYEHGAEKLLKQAEQFRAEGSAITIKRLNERLYHPKAVPIVIAYDWGDEHDESGIPTRQAVTRMVRTVLFGAEDAQVAETVDTMRPYLLGTPCGGRSSLFVNETTGQMILKTYKALVDSGMFGPLYTGKAIKAARR